MCMCVYVCVYMNVYMWIYMCILCMSVYYVNACVWKSSFVCVWLCVYMRLCTCLWLSVYMYWWVWRKTLFSSPVPEVQRCLMASALGVIPAPFPLPCYCQCHGGLCLLGLCLPCAWQTLARGNGWRSPQGSRWPTVWSLPQCMHSQSPSEVGSRSAQSHRCGTCEVDRGVSLRNSRLQTQTWTAEHPARFHFLRFHGLPSGYCGDCAYKQSI